MADQPRDGEDTLSRIQRIGHFGDWEWDITTNAVAWSDELFRIYGYTPHEVNPDYDLVLKQMRPDSKADFQAAIDAALEHDQHFEMNYRFLRKDGSEAVLHTVGEVIRDPAGAPIKMFGIVQDITESIKTEETLREAKHFAQSLIKTTPQLIYIYDLEKKKNIFANREIAGVIGYSTAEIQAMGSGVMSSILHPEDAAKVAEHHQKMASAGGEVIELEYRMKDSGGHWRTLLSRDRAFARNDSGAVTQIIGVCEDITETSRMQNALLDSERKYRSFVESANDGILTISIAEMRFVEANPSICQMLGYEREELFALGIKDIHPAAAVPCVLEIFGQMLKGDVQIAESLPVLKKDGSIFFADIGATVIELDGQVHVLGIFRDITVRKQTEDALRKRERQLSESQQVARIGSWSHNVPEHTVEWSEEVFRRFDKDSRAFEPSIEYFFERIHHDDRKLVQKAIQAAIENDQRYHVQARIINESGREWIMEAFGRLEKDENGNPARLSGTVQDITEQKQLQEQLIQAQKIESVGRLAGGIAHDFNNSLQVILGEVELVKLETPGDSSLQESLATIQRAAEHSADITQQLLSFARQQIIDPKILDLNKTVNESIDLLQRLIGEDINMSWRPKAGASLVMMDPVKIQQVLTNLCVNARDAINGVGNIGIITDNVSLSADDCQGHTDFYPGDFITLEVRDDGSGMQPETLEHLFEPFFTTRGYGAGTGLGLATVYGIIKQIDGFIDVKSSPEQGSSFKIYLPLVADAEADSGLQGDARIMEAGRGETLLLVEDEIAVLELSVKILERLGYKVIPAATPEAALQVAEEHIDEIEFLITDIIMPEMNGQELAARLLKQKPELKCLFMSGYTDDIIARNGILEDEIDFIQKPFSMKEIAIKLRTIAGAEAQEPAG